MLDSEVYNIRHEDPNLMKKSKSFHVLTGLWGKDIWKCQAQYAFGDTIKKDFSNISDFFNADFPMVNEYFKSNLNMRRHFDTNLGLDHYI